MALLSLSIPEWGLDGKGEGRRIPYILNGDGKGAVVDRYRTLGKVPSVIT